VRLDSRQWKAVHFSETGILCRSEESIYAIKKRYYALINVLMNPRPMRNPEQPDFHYMIVICDVFIRQTLLDPPLSNQTTIHRGLD